jgi:ankyrin repeat protein
MSRQHLALVIVVCAVGVTNAQEPAKIDFIRDVQPLFKAHCFDCHGPKQQKNAFRLDRRLDALRGGTATMIGPGNAEASQLYLRLIGDRAGLQMPPDGALSPEQIQLIKVWIDQGAVWPEAVSGAIAPPPADSGATRMMEVLRQGDRAAFRNLLRAQPQSATRQGPGGATPLMYAALYGEAEDVRLLLDAGADPNVRNEVGATALMWAVDDLDKTRLLLRRGADVSARSDDGRTPLLVATTWSQSYEVVKLLLDQGANASPVVNSYRGPLTSLRLAAELGDEAVLHLLVDRGVDPQALKGVPLLLATQGEDAILCADLLIKSADPKALKPAALFLAPPFASPRALRDAAALKKLVDNGADLATRDQAGRTALMAAVTSDDVSNQTIETMLQLGADVNASTTGGKTVLDFARQRGNTPVVDLLAKAGAKSGNLTGPPDAKPRPAASARAAVAASLPLLQRADVTFLRKTGCVSCHNNSLTALTVSAARKAGIPVDEPATRSQRKETGTYIEIWRERALQGMGIPGDNNTVSYLLFGLAAEEYPPDAATDALARFLKNTQLPDGHWRLFANRPPLESSEIEMTAVALRALQTYAPKAQRSAYERSLWRAADWIRTARATTTADRVFQLLGLAWAGDAKDTLSKTARDLLAEQRTDGGWGQIPSLASDAFATGQALVALNDSGALAVTDAAYQRGVKYLLANQLEDGSWFVRSRAIPFQPYFESGFPHGHDQWISAAATNWATTALIRAVQ